MRTIPTKYKGISYRSRLEARWAYLFDLLDVKVFYEPEGFILDDGTWYLPDFFVTGNYEVDGERLKGMWLECKGLIDSDSIQKPLSFARCVGPIVVVEQVGSPSVMIVDDMIGEVGLLKCDCQVTFSNQDLSGLRCTLCGQYVSRVCDDKRLVMKINSKRF